jgi:hypothetical protein
MTRGGFTHPNAPAEPGVVSWDATPCDLAAQEQADGGEPTKKRRKNTSYTQFAMKECRKRGWHPAIVEKFVAFPKPGHRVDLFGVIDIVAIVPPDDLLLGHAQIIGIQCTNRTGHVPHRDKILAEPRARMWVEAGARLELWTWARRKVGRATRWAMRTEAFRSRWRADGFTSEAGSSPDGAEVSWWDGPMVWSSSPSKEVADADDD